MLRWRISGNSNTTVVGWSKVLHDIPLGILSEVSQTKTNAYHLYVEYNKNDTK